MLVTKELGLKALGSKPATLLITRLSVIVNDFLRRCPKAYLEPSRTSTMEFFNQYLLINSSHFEFIMIQRKCCYNIIPLTKTKTLL